jgi:hypothetical protein
MERCCGQAAIVCADHVNLWWGVDLLIPLLTHTDEFYFVANSMCGQCQHLGSCTKNIMGVG